MKIPVPVLRLLNPLVAALLRSPLHGLMSRDVLLITFTGRKSGRRYTTPVSYVRDGDSVRCFTSRSTAWWRNLQGGAPVSLRIAGEECRGQATAVVDEPDRVGEALQAFLERLPRDAVYYDVALDSHGKPKPGEVKRAAQEVVLIEIRLDTRA